MKQDDCADVAGHNCDEALERLYEYLDSELDQATSEGIRAHLDDCGYCSGSFDFEKRLKLVVKERLSEEVPQQFIMRLRGALDRETTRT
jgi:mycothiol system anti-sigma-R factor